MKVLTIVMASAALFGAEEATRLIEKSYPLTGNSRTVVVCGMSGGIHVTTGGGSEVRFSVKEKLAAPSRERLEEIRKEVDVVFAQEAGVVRAAVRGPWSSGDDCGMNGNRNTSRRRNWDGDHVKFEHEFTITAPADVKLELRNVNGGIDVTGFTGNYSLHTVNGKVTLKDAEGAGDVKTVNGTIVASYRRNPQADVQFSTVNGKFDLYFQPSLNAEFSMKTLNGSAYTDFDMTAVASEASAGKDGMRRIQRRDRSAAMRVGSGGPKIGISTVNGEILIHSMAKARP